MVEYWYVVVIAVDDDDDSDYLRDNELAAADKLMDKNRMGTKAYYND